MSSTCCDATMALSVVSMLFTGAIILRCQKTRLDEFISILVTRKRYLSLDRGIGYRRRFDSLHSKNYPNFFRCSRQKGISLHNFSNMSTIVSVLVRTTVRQYATIFLKMHLLGNCKFGKDCREIAVCRYCHGDNSCFVCLSTSSV